MAWRNSFSDKMSLKCCVIFSSLIIVVLARIDNQGNVSRPTEVQSGDCKCVNYDCGCCEHLKLKEIHLDNTVCANLSYLPDDYGISVTVTFDSFAVINETVSVRNPPALCIGQPFMKQIEVALCIRFHDLDANRHYLHGCVSGDVEIHRKILAKYDFGCFDVGHKNKTAYSDDGNITTNSKRGWWYLDRTPQVNMI